MAAGAGVATGDISWAAHGVFDTRRLAGSAEADASPRFHAVTLTGTVAGDVSQAQLDELAGEARDDACGKGRSRLLAHSLTEQQPGAMQAAAPAPTCSPARACVHGCAANALGAAPPLCPALQPPRRRAAPYPSPCTPMCATHSSWCERRERHLVPAGRWQRRRQQRLACCGPGHWAA